MERQSKCRSVANWHFGLCVISVAWMALGICGCGGGVDGPQRYSVTGTVVYNGEPVPFGEIIFEPDGDAGNSGPQGFAKIKNGKYETAGDRGVVGGPHKIVISGYPTDPANEDEENPIEALFQGYQTTLDLPKDNATQNFEVPGEGDAPGDDA